MNKTLNHLKHDYEDGLNINFWLFFIFFSWNILQNKVNESLTIWNLWFTFFLSQNTKQDSKRKHFQRYKTFKQINKKTKNKFLNVKQSGKRRNNKSEPLVEWNLFLAFFNNIQLLFNFVCFCFCSACEKHLQTLFGIYFVIIEIENELFFSQFSILPWKCKILKN